MPFDDLRSFLVHLETQGPKQLRRVRAEVDSAYEITEIATRVVREEGPALLFERVKGSRFPLAINFLGSHERIEMALGMHPQELGERLVGFAEKLNPPDISGLWASRDLAPRLMAFRPRQVGGGPAQTIVDTEPDLDTLPILTCWPGDGGPFITFPLVITHSPSDGKSNMGIYRMHKYDRTTTGMHWQIQKGGGFHYHEAEKRGQPLDVAVVLGADPALMLAGIFPLPEGMEEVAFAGIIRGRRTRLTAAKSLDIRVPANAEFILEGVVTPGERRMEGPFGDHFGHYSEAADFPVFHVKTVTRRRDAIYPAAVVGKPPQEDRYMGEAAQEITGPLIKLIRPEVTDVWAYYESGFHNLLVVSVEGRYTREPVRTALGILGEGQLGLTKCLLLVDPSVNVRNFAEVLRAVREHFDPHEHFHLISRAPLDTLDFTSYRMHHGSRMIINATGNRAQYSGGGRDRDDTPAARDVVIGRDPKEIAPGIARWRLWEDALLVVQLERRGQNIGKRTISQLVRADELSTVKIIAAVSPDIDLDDDVDTIWGIFTRFDPARDVTFTAMSMSGIQPNYNGVMGIDATFKPGYPEPLVMDEDVVKKVDARWQEYWK